MKMEKGKQTFLELVKRLPKIFAHNWKLKLVSLVLALILWSSVLYANPSITRGKTLNGLDISATGQSLLSTRGLALLTDVSEQIEDARVRLALPYSDYAYATNDTVNVYADLSTVRRAGTQTVRLTATTAYGTVESIMPETVEVVIEEQDQRTIPVNVTIEGEKMDSTWYNINRTNPAQFTVTGPSSVVQTIASAQVYLDVTDRTESFSRALPIELLDSQGEQVSNSNITKSTMSVSVGVDIYPSKQIPVETEIAKCIKGQVQQGYRVTNVEVSPDVLTVAAEQSLLDTLSEITIEQVSVSGASETFTAKANVSALKDFKYVSSNQVNVTVTIEEEQRTKSVINLTPVAMGLGEDYNAAWEIPQCSIIVTGNFNAVRNLERSDILLMVDMEDLEAGEYVLPIEAYIEGESDMEYQIDPETVTVVITAKQDTASETDE